MTVNEINNNDLKFDAFGMPYNLSKEEREHCDEVIEKGFEKLNKADNKLLKDNNAHDYINAERDIIEKNHRMTYKFKLDTLLYYLEVCNRYIQELQSDLDPKTIRYIVMLMSIAERIIGRSNIMQGHESIEHKSSYSHSFELENTRASLQEIMDHVKQIKVVKEQKTINKTEEEAAQ